MANSASSPTNSVLNGNRNFDSLSINWSEEIERNRGWLRKVLRCRIGDAQAVEDCLQEIAMAVVRQANKPTEPGKIPAWFYRLAVRQAVNFHRTNGRRNKLLSGYQTSYESTAESPFQPIDWLIRNEQQDQVRAALGNLRPVDREILLLKFSENWSYKEMAIHLGVTTTTIEYRLVRAKKRLRQALMNLTENEVTS